MKRFILAQNGEEVKIGDVLTISKEDELPIIGKCILTRDVMVDKTTIPGLINSGIIKSVSIDSVGVSIPTLEYYIKNIANKLGWKFEKTRNYLNTIHSIMPAAAFSIVLREIAIELDKKYKDHIENSPEIYVVSTLDGRITKANKAHIKNYRNFAAFRSIEDAKIACSITRDILKYMFKNGK